MERTRLFVVEKLEKSEEESFNRRKRAGAVGSGNGSDRARKLAWPRAPMMTWL
jgi:protein subunit release factor A